MKDDYPFDIPSSNFYNYSRCTGRKIIVQEPKFCTIEADAN
tara:strand:- start:4542 stop:4664 length:123 start_codon:yes stop_codon:yes gene_type:complete